MLGKGAVHTSSPARPRTGRPSSSNTSTASVAARLDLAAIDGQRRLAGREAGDDVGAAADAAEAHVALHALVDEVEAVRGERASGGQDRAQRREVVLAARARRPPSRRARATSRSCRTPRAAPATTRSQRIGRSRSDRRAVVEHDRRADRQAGHEPVPHHPPAGREVEDPVVRARDRCGARAP